MKNSTYWANRFKALEDRQYRKSAAFVEGLKAKFDYADDELETSLYKWYSKLMKNTDAPSLNDAKKLLKENELKEFHWTLEQYEKYAKEHDLDPEWIKKLENASARKHISRYEQIQLQMRQIEEKLYAEYNNECYGYLGELVEDSYYHTAYEIEKGTGIGIDLHKLDRDTVEKYLTHPWCQDGKVFSDRIWQRKDELVRTLDQELTRQLINGTDPQKAIDAISDKFDVSKRQAGTLVMTESAAIASEASKDSMKNLGVEEYEILVTLDSHTSEICQEMDGQHFRMSEYNPGLTAPPFHPNCRSTTIPYFDDEFTTGETRAARDKNDKDYERVPADMKYGEWKEKYVIGSEGIISNDEKAKSNIIFELNGKEDKFAQAKDIILNMERQYNTRLHQVTIGAKQAAGDVDITGNTMRLNSNKTETVLHEFAHTLANSDADKYGLSDNEDFWKEIETIRREYRKNVGQDSSRWISSYEHSSKSKDEFFAEAFTQAKMKEMGLDLPEKYGSDFTYSQRVLDVTNKYFGKAERTDIIDHVSDIVQKDKEVAFSVKDDKINPMKDITQEWTEVTKVGEYIERDFYEKDGITYGIPGDGSIVKKDHDDNEKTIARTLADKYGKKVELLPRVDYPENVQVPDYLIDGNPFDLKSPTGSGKDVLRDMIKRKKKQSPNFMFNVSKCSLPAEELERQIKVIFTAPNTKFVKQIAIVNLDEILKVYLRK